MISVKNIKLVDGIITCDIKGEESNFSMEVSVENWDKLEISIGGDVYDACHVRNRLYHLYNENNGKLPKSFTLNFG
ncbi:hypothetical protein [Roseburia sp. MSJ-14]|uniref:hypothetical protein n=1 Tax=Roseburia sp. MSJ-14 TaxID=2841514 RepID=UPI001C1050E4|nr:hypothetical protein [Roseburia sp. MSJ-14]MBU5473573.1 hypothetical protein [Roseburia sp. MSJ-14]